MATGRALLSNLIASVNINAVQKDVFMAYVHAAWQYGHEPNSMGAAMPRRATDRRMALAREWDQLISEIREVPSFSDFLKPLNYEQLLPAAQDGPVIVINVSQWRCDALIVDKLDVRVVELPDLTLKDAYEYTKQFLEKLEQFDEAEIELRSAQLIAQGTTTVERLAAVGYAMKRETALTAANKMTAEVLEWLWKTIIDPIREQGHLPITDEGLSRVWWCPTGPLAMLPVHAASDGQGQSLIDLVVSSYTPTLRALIHARRPNMRDRTVGKNGILLVSTFNKTDGAPTEKLLGKLPKVFRLVGEMATVSSVTRELPRYRVVHFNSHGDQDLYNPSRGGLQLSDGKLRVSDIAELTLEGDFAGLAACKTAVGGIELLDESITLASGLHYAGFRHVIGTLWSIAASDADYIFDGVYEELATNTGFDPTNAARSLQKAVSSLKREHPDEPHRWASLIHVGP